MFGIDDVLLGAGISGGLKLLGGAMSDDAANKRADQNAALQREFAQNGVTWKVADAKRAGINPLAALGASTTSFSNVVGGTSLGDSVGEAGQDIGRAVAATGDDSKRLSLLDLEAKKEQIKGLQLDNQERGLRIAKMMAPHVGPAMPTATNPKFIDGQGNTPSLGQGTVKIKPSEINPGSPDNLGTEPGVGPDVNFAATADGGFSPQPSADAMKRMSNDFVGMLMWNLRNRLGSSLGSHAIKPPDYLLPKGKTWEYNTFNQSWYPVTPDWFTKARDYIHGR